MFTLTQFCFNVAFVLQIRKQIFQLVAIYVQHNHCPALKTFVLPVTVIDRPDFVASMTDLETSFETYVLSHKIHFQTYELPLIQ